MQGINKSRHEHLADALLQMEQLLTKECDCLQQAGEYGVELEKGISVEMPAFPVLI